eukprot:11957399-Alexandrium_andersonii.AAC.1
MSAEDWAGIVGALRPLEGSAGPLSAATVYEASDLEGSWVVLVPRPAIPAAIAALEPQRDLLG